MPFELFRKKFKNNGLALFRGTLPPRLDELELNKVGVSAKPHEGLQNVHWAADLKHPAWGKALLVAPRRAQLPPDFIIDMDARLSDDEKQLARQAGTGLHLITESRTSYVLSDKKMLLRFLQAVLGVDGLIAVDRTSQRLWSRQDLEDEMAHDADLDVEALFTLHMVRGERGTWLHTHGLAEMGALDLDVLNPSDDAASASMFDLFRALAFHVVDGQRGESNFALAQPDGEVRLVPVESFNKRAAAKWLAIREMDDDSHNHDRFVICEPQRGLLARWSKSVQPSKFLMGEIPDGYVISFSDAATELMSGRARMSFKLFRQVVGELAELELPMLVKLGYDTDSGPPGAREHLWFRVHSCGESSMDATLVNQPFDIGRMHEGQRGEHAVDSLTDWLILSPAGSITPRDLGPLRAIRAHKDELLAELRAN